MSVVIDEHDVTVLLGDVREQLATLPDESVQCIVTSPPYYGLRDYGVDGQIGLEASPTEYVAEMVGVFREARRVLASDGVLWLNLGDSYSTTQRGNDNGWDKSRLSNPGRVQKMQFASLRVGRKTEFDRPAKNLMGIPWRVAFALQDDGWILRNAIIWHKTNAMPESVTDRLSCRYEHVFLFSKQRRYTFDLDPIREPLAYPEAADGTRVFGGANKGEHHRSGPGSSQRRTGNRYGAARPWANSEQGGDHDAASPRGRNPGDVWVIPTVPFPGAHFATMPAELARRCILAGCPDDGTVLDPFAGSGTTLKVARSLGHNSVGIELNPAYVEIIRERIGQTPLDFGESA